MAKKPKRHAKLTRDCGPYKAGSLVSCADDPKHRPKGARYVDPERFEALAGGGFFAQPKTVEKEEG